MEAGRQWKEGSSGEKGFNTKIQPRQCENSEFQEKSYEGEQRGTG